MIKSMTYCSLNNNILINYGIRGIHHMLHIGLYHTNPLLITFSNYMPKLCFIPYLSKVVLK